MHISWIDDKMQDESFNESAYLAMYPDVKEAVERGTFSSGYEHFCRYGRREGRRGLRVRDEDRHFVRDYTKLVQELVASHPHDIDLAMAKAIGSSSLESFVEFGDKHVQILRRLGLRDGQAIYDLACGSGRTASALQRHGWRGDYRGADVIHELVDYAASKMPGFTFFVHRDFSINAPDWSQDIIYAWSLFTHLQLEEIYLYAQDCRRALKLGGLLVFSFLELGKPGPDEVFRSRVDMVKHGAPLQHLDTFLDRTTIARLFQAMLGYELVEIMDADDPSITTTGAFGQSIAVFRK
jgi:ubiquinone/menaquinone biosynthesis C-methylase UbiE